MSVLSKYDTRILIDFLLSTTKYFSTEDIYISNVLYERRLLNEIEITKQLSDVYWGIIEPQTIKVELSNADGLFNTLESGQELRNKDMKFQVYEPLEGTSFLTYGKVIDYDLKDVAAFTVLIQDPDPLNAIIPEKTYETTDFSESPPNIINPAYDLGKAYNICFGYCKKVPLRYIHANYTSNYFDYLICYGTIESNDTNKATTVNIYRSKVLVASSEYTVYDGSQGALYPGLAFIRFTKEQIDFSGAPYEITADIRGMKLGGDASATRNFVRAIQHLLSNSAWGLGLSLDTSSFDTAAGQMTALLCDGFISEQKNCSDILNELLFCCRGGLSYNASGNITISCDVLDSSVNYTFGHKDGTWENIVEISENKKTQISEAFKSFSLKYGWNQWEGKYSHRNKRTIFTFGDKKIIEIAFVQDHTTADRITSYVKYRSIYGDRRLTIVVGKEARDIAEGKNANVILPDYAINGVFQVRKVEKRGMNTFSLDLNSWDAAIYTYVAGSMPNNANDDALADYSQTPPSPPTNFSKTSDGSYQASDGATAAYILLQADAPSSANFAKMRFGWRKNGETYYTYVEGNKPSSGSTWNARIDGLVPGLSYDYIAISENAYCLLSSGNPTLTNQAAPGDATAPAVPTGMAVTGGLQSIIITWADNTEADLAGYKVYISTTQGFTPGPSNLKYTGSGTRVEYPADNGVTYYVRIRAFDRLMNYSGYTSEASGAPDATAPPVPNQPTLTTGAGVSPSDGSTYTWVKANWNDVSAADLAGYEVRYKEGSGGDYTRFKVGAASGESDALWLVKPNVTIYVNVRSYDVAGNRSAWSTEASILSAKKDTAPSAPSGLTVDAVSFHNVFLSWTNPSDPDLKYIEIWRSSTNDSSTATRRARTSGREFVDVIASNPPQTRYYWVKAFDASGNASGFHPTQYAGVPAVTAKVDTPDIEDLAIGNAQIENCAVDKLSAGTFTGKYITLVQGAGSDAKIQGGAKADFTRANSGFILGIDQSAGNDPKFIIGDASHYLMWANGELIIKGKVETSELVTQVPNGSFEVVDDAGAPDGWDTSGTVAITSSTQAHGLNSVYLTTVNPAGSVAWIRATDFIPINRHSNFSHILSFNILAASPALSTVFEARILCYDSTKASLGTIQQDIQYFPSTWTPFVWRFNPPITTSWIKVQLYLNIPGSAGTQTVRIDNVRLNDMQLLQYYSAFEAVWGNSGSIAAGATWMPVSGMYRLCADNNTDMKLDLLCSGTWRQGYGMFAQSDYLCDGTNQRFRNGGAVARTVYFYRMTSDVLDTPVMSASGVTNLATGVSWNGTDLTAGYVVACSAAGPQLEIRDKMINTWRTHNLAIAALCYMGKFGTADQARVTNSNAASRDIYWQRYNGVAFINRIIRTRVNFAASEFKETDAGTEVWQVVSPTGNIKAQIFNEDTGLWMTGAQAGGLFHIMEASGFINTDASADFLPVHKYHTNY